MVASGLTKGDLDLGQNEVPLLFLLLLSYFFRSLWQDKVQSTAAWQGNPNRTGEIEFSVDSSFSCLLPVLHLLGSLAPSHEEMGIGPSTGSEFLWGLLIMGLFNDKFFEKQEDCICYLNLLQYILTTPNPNSSLSVSWTHSLSPHSLSTSCSLFN